MKKLVKSFTVYMLVAVSSIVVATYYASYYANKNLQKYHEDIKRQIKELEDQIKYVDESNKKVINDKLKKLEDKINQQNEITDKIKNFIRKINPSITPTNAEYLAKNFVRVSKEYDIPIQILLAVAWQESHFTVDAMNKDTKCIGIMQINPNVWKTNFPVEMLYLPHINIEIGGFILKYYYDLTGSWEKAIVRYYGISKYAEVIYKPKVQKRISKVAEYVSY